MSTIRTDGQILYCLLKATTTYLIQRDGTVNHTWSSTYMPGCMTRWIGDGNILRSIKVGNDPGFGGGGGGVQKVNWNGTVYWEFFYNTDGHFSHHDIRQLPNGNVLMIAWETKTRKETIDAGRNPAYVPTQGFMPDHIIEVQPTGQTSGDIVWEWHVWDHLIQDYDLLKPNYGIVGDHPELVDINFVAVPIVDWMHTNSIDYNEEFDQIVISVRHFNEIWVIDHSTTTEEAAGHTGGNSGKGGDLLYRWGNPQTYDAGNASDQKFFMQHDANWIDEGCPGAGHILVFNNGYTRPGEPYSTVDEIVPPVDSNGSYYLEPGSAYGPAEPIWQYIADPPTMFYSWFVSGALRLQSGNTLITDGAHGELFEVTTNGTNVWRYLAANQLFKVDFVYPENHNETEPPENVTIPDLDCFGSLSWNNVEPGDIVLGSFRLQNIGGPNSTLNWTINISSITWGTWTFNPESGDNLTPDDGQVAVHVSVVAPDEVNSDFDGFIRVENRDNTSDFDIIPVYLKTPLSLHTVPMTWYQLFIKRIHFFLEKIYTLFQQSI